MGKEKISIKKPLFILSAILVTFVVALIALTVFVYKSMIGDFPVFALGAAALSFVILVFFSFAILNMMFREAESALFLKKTTDELTAVRLCRDAILSVMDAPYALIGRDLKIKEVNKAFLNLLDYDEGEVVEEAFLRFYEGESGDEPLFLRLKKISGIPGKVGGIKGIKGWFMPKFGAKAPVTVSAAELNDGLIVFLATDMTEMESLENELRTTRTELSKRIDDLEEFREGVLYMLRNLDESEKELEESYHRLKETQAQLIHSAKLKALGELAAGLAHELNQPLTVIRGLTQHIYKKATETNSPDCEKLRIIDNATHKMETVINHLRIFSRLDKPVFSRVNINDVINNAFIVVGELVKKHSITVELDLNNVPLINGNENRLEQVVINLIINSRDAMPNGGTLKISTSEIAEGGEKFVRMSIADTGIGVSKEIMDRIFEPFFTTKDVNKGTGLGLSISYGIIKDHNGVVTVESEEGKGAAFHITIPSLKENAA